MKVIVYTALLLLVVLHQDFWFWGRHEPLVFGFLPPSLAWHAGISLWAGVLWACAVRFCWPANVDVLDDATGESQ